jgi:hypothetical protein
VDGGFGIGDFASVESGNFFSVGLVDFDIHLYISSITSSERQRTSKRCMMGLALRASSFPYRSKPTLSRPYCVPQSPK